MERKLDVLGCVDEHGQERETGGEIGEGHRGTVFGRPVRGQREQDLSAFDVAQIAPADTSVEESSVLPPDASESREIESGHNQAGAQLIGDVKLLIVAAMCS